MYNKTMRLRWWVLLNSIVVGLILAAKEGAVKFAWHADATKLSFITWGIFFIITGFIGYLTINQGKQGRDTQQDLRYINACWFGSELLMGLGLIGTVLGIILMFTGSAAGLDLGNISLMKTAILSMSTGLTTAFVTTLSGIATSLLTKLQLVNYEVEMETKLDETK